jgi:hypothetical protein
LFAQLAEMVVDLLDDYLRVVTAKQEVKQFPTTLLANRIKRRKAAELTSMSP